METNGKNTSTNIDEKQYLYNKEVCCPVCGNDFKVPVVKTTAYRVKNKESDFYINYSLINPYFYDVWLCNKCGYASMKSDFDKIKKHEIKLIKEGISPKWNKRSYPDIFNVNIAIERYKLSLLNNSIIGSKASKKAMNCLKIAWMYRLLNDTENEQLFLNQALTAFNDAYFNEDFPIYGMDRYATLYLLGELNKRIGNDKEALMQFSNVITNPSASRKIKDLAIDQKNFIKDNAISKTKTKTEIETEPIKKKNLFSRFFE